MKLKRVYIQNYGPLKETGYDFHPGFTLLTGRNEAGKTLTIEALLRLLFKNKQCRKFSGLERVSEKPEGHVYLEYEETEYKIPEQDYFPGITGLTAEECLNIFVVKSSQLAIPEEGDFYTGVTDRITGLRSEEIDHINSLIKKEARLTPQGHFQDTGETRLKSRLNEAGSLLEKIKELMRRGKDENLDHLEENLAALQKEKENLHHKLEEMELARHREKFEKAGEALSRLEKAYQACQGLEHITEQDEQAWREKQQELEIKEEEALQQKEKITRLHGQLKELEENIKEEQNDFELLQQRKKEIEEEITPAVKNFEKLSTQVERQQVKSSRLRPLAMISAILLLISSAGSFFQPVWWAYLASGVTLVLAAFLWYPEFKLAGGKGELAAQLKSLELKMNSLGYEVSGPGDIKKCLGEFRLEYSSREQGLQEMQSRQKMLQDKIDELQEHYLPQLEKEIRDLKEKIEEIKKRTGEEDLNRFRDRLNYKNRQKNTIEKEKSVLENLLGKEGNSWEEMLSRWKERLQELAPYRDRAPGVAYQEKKVEQLKQNTRELYNQEKEMEQKMEHFKNELAQVERKANQVLATENSDEYLPCQAVTDLEQVKRELKRFLEENNNQKQAALLAVSVFEEIQHGEKEKVSKLFGEESKVSRYFRETSGNRYQNVYFDQEAGKAGAITVQQTDGTLLLAEQLSGGAYDQLYFSIRMALGEKLLQGKKGFFIMDDPFIKADFKRLEKQLKALKEISSRGWQVIYFTAKKEVKEALESEINRGEVNCREVNHLTAPPLP